ncbi:MAG TPA: hypothetical protein VKM93_21925 [Terriglobia bacterium]|nr:hypothetical protein [Terriglobia bacterium]
MVAATHVHPDRHNCLEMVIMKWGPSPIRF